MMHTYFTIKKKTTTMNRNDHAHNNISMFHRHTIPYLQLSNSNFNPMKTIQALFLSALFLIGIAGCSNGESASNADEAGTNDNGSIVITKAQFAASNMQTGRPDTAIFREKVHANGYVKAAPAGKARVTVLVPGKVTGIYFNVGDRVSKGERLFSMAGNEIIQLQTEYAEAENALRLLKQNYERQKLLSEENINAKKTLQEAETQLKSMKIKVSAYKTKLGLMGINTARVKEGKIYSEVLVTAPLGGYITSQDLQIGEVIETDHVTAEIVDPDRMQLELYVYPKDLPTLAVGQKVHFFLPDQPEIIFHASLSKTGKQVNPDKRNVLCIASLAREDIPRFIDGNFVEADIITHEKKSLAVAGSAIAEENGKYFVYVKSGESDEAYTFEKMEVAVGITQANLFELTEYLDREILVEGMYFMIE